MCCALYVIRYTLRVVRYIIRCTRIRCTRIVYVTAIHYTYNVVRYTHEGDAIPIYVAHYTYHVLHDILYDVRHTFVRYTLWIARSTLCDIHSTLHALRKMQCVLYSGGICARVPLVRAQSARADGCTFLVKIKIKIKSKITIENKNKK